MLVGDQDPVKSGEIIYRILFKRKIARINQYFLIPFLDQKIGLWIFSDLHAVLKLVVKLNIVKGFVKIAFYLRACGAIG